MRYAKIAPKVANVTCGRKVLEDKTISYPESMFRVGHFDELIRRGFLIPDEEPVIIEKTISNPDEAPTTRKFKLTKAYLQKNPELKEQGFKVGDEIDIPIED